MREFRNVASHPQDLADGKVLAAGQVTSLSTEALKENQVLIDEGILDEVKPAKTKEGGS